jgi:acetyl-CoA carboxylase biotin carboxyl carrier protein
MGTEEDITYAEILRVLSLIKAAEKFEHIHLKFGDVEINLSREPGQTVQPTNQIAQPSRPTVPPLPTLQPPVENSVSKPASPRPAQDAAPAAAAEPDHAWPVGSILVRSPMVGTFYRKPSPDAAPFVEIGQQVEEGSTLCIVEVMKLMSSINAGARGTIRQILVADAELVEADQILMVIESH